MRLKPHMRTSDRFQFFFSLFTIAISSACHLVALAQLRSIEYYFNPYYLWDIQYQVLLCLSFAATVWIVFVNKTVLIIVNLVVRIGILILLGMPLGNSLNVEQMLLIPIILSAGVGLRFPTNTVISFFSVVIVLLFQSPWEVMRLVVPTPTISEKLDLSEYR